jgi:hypothetical protein
MIERHNATIKDMIRQYSPPQRGYTTKPNAQIRKWDRSGKVKGLVGSINKDQTAAMMNSRAVKTPANMRALLAAPKKLTVIGTPEKGGAFARVFRLLEEFKKKQGKGWDFSAYMISASSRQAFESVKRLTEAGHLTGKGKLYSIPARVGSSCPVCGGLVVRKMPAAVFEIEGKRYVSYSPASLDREWDLLKNRLAK